VELGHGLLADLARDEEPIAPVLFDLRAFLIGQ
jgi:hypothetical protein